MKEHYLQKKGFFSDVLVYTSQISNDQQIKRLLGYSPTNDLSKNV